MALEIVTHPPVAFEDPRGIILNILSGHEIRHVAFITSKKGTIRANHWHPHTVVRDEVAMSGAQWIYVLRGSYISVACNLLVGWGKEDEVAQPKVQFTGPVERQVVAAGDLVYTPPEVAHAQWFTEETEFLNIDGVTRESEGYGVRHTFLLSAPLIELGTPHQTTSGESCAGPMAVDKPLAPPVVGDPLGANIDYRRCLACRMAARPIR